MTRKDTQRLVWAVNILSVEPGDQILEIGCGVGGAVSLVCEKLEEGQITAIDRSEAMIELARKRNQQSIKDGKAVFHVASLHQADFGNERFNKVFAFNVSSLYKQPPRDLEKVKQILMPSGSLYLFSELPYGKDMDIEQWGQLLTRCVQEQGFCVKQVFFGQMRPMPVVCVIASP